MGSKTTGRALTDPLMTTEEAAEYLRTSPSTMRYWHSLGKGPRSVKIGVRRLYKLSDCDQFVEDAYAEQNEVRA